MRNILLFPNSTATPLPPTRCHTANAIALFPDGNEVFLGVTSETGWYLLYPPGYLSDPTPVYFRQDSPTYLGWSTRPYQPATTCHSPLQPRHRTGRCAVYHLAITDYRDVYDYTRTPGDADDRIRIEGRWIHPRQPEIDENQECYLYYNQRQRWDSKAYIATEGSGLVPGTSTVDDKDLLIWHSIATIARFRHVPVSLLTCRGVFGLPAELRLAEVGTLYRVANSHPIGLVGDCCDGDVAPLPEISCKTPLETGIGLTDGLLTPTGYVLDLGTLTVNLALPVAAVVSIELPVSSTIPWTVTADGVDVPFVWGERGIIFTAVGNVAIGGGGIFSNTGISLGFRVFVDGQEYKQNEY